MRRKERMLTDSEALSILEEGEYGILSTVSPDNEPYGIPLNYCVMNGRIYFHSAIEGTKIANIENNPAVSFCVVAGARVLSERFTSLYESCIVSGTAAEASGSEKQNALEMLIHKYSGSHIPEGLEYIEKLKNKTRVFSISIESITGKANR
ncbi:MAG: pyridoxamine 5'-phosphate oxidase family protein [Verrucomicrobiota bacterium]